MHLRLCSEYVAREYLGHNGQLTQKVAGIMIINYDDDEHDAKKEQKRKARVKSAASTLIITGR